MLAGGLYLVLQPDLHWDSSAWATFFILIAASITFISLFYLLGLMVSARSKHASVSIFNSLFLWVLLILVLPNMSPYIAAQLYQIPSVNKIEREATRLTNIERDELGRKLSREVTRKYEQQYGRVFSDYIAISKDEIRQRVAADAEFKTMHESYRGDYEKAWGEANRIQGEKASKLRRDLNQKAERQKRVAKRLACISPYADFVYLATDLSGTGLRSLDYFSRVAGQYSTQFYDYLAKRTEQAREQDPTFDSNSFIDVSDRPRFHFKEEALNNRLEAVLPYWGVLVFFNVVFFAGAFVAFLRYDVR
jgi:ABC-type transport system involved in multi-copper enzyme maturation permease subunit